MPRLDLSVLDEQRERAYQTRDKTKPVALADSTALRQRSASPPPRP